MGALTARFGAECKIVRMKSLCWSAFGLFTLLSLSANAQNNGVGTFHFKNAYLGMTLAEFRVAMAGDKVWVNNGKPDWRGLPRKKDAKELATPLCTDGVPGFIGVEVGNLQSGEVVCNASPGAINPTFLEIREQAVRQILYRFMNGRLYEISIQSAWVDFSGISLGFQDKYGPPDKTDRTPYQNQFGAAWTGKNMFWHQGNQLIVLSEGPGGGPGQTGDALCSASISDRSIAPKAPASKMIDF